MPAEVPILPEPLDILRRAALPPAESEHPYSLVANWPDPPKAEAFYGLAGEWVRMVEPHTEADPAALLLQFLAGLGNLPGRAGHFCVEADRHHTNLFVAIVGQTSNGRKGTSLGQVTDVLRHIDPEWYEGRFVSGLSTGEGLIHAVRDEMRGPLRDKGRIVENGEEVVVDPGVKDKRLFAVEGEFASVLQRMGREGNTLSSILRSSWDGVPLNVLNKSSQERAATHHISVVVHITKDELKRLLTSTESANGFSNRFLWVCAKRSKCLPRGGRISDVNFSDIIRRLKNAAEFARTAEAMDFEEQAGAIWDSVYPSLSEGKPGLVGAVTSRAAPQVLRLACIYALLDCSEVVRAEHLMAGLGVWEYCLDSARFIFGDAMGDTTADDILRTLRVRPEGMTRTDLRDHFGRHKHSSEIDRALNLLKEYGRARMAKDQTAGRPIEQWYAV